LERRARSGRFASTPRDRRSGAEDAQETEIQGRAVGSVT
jgi:hypothetical protein